MDFSKVKEFMNFMAAKQSPGNSITIYLGGKKVFEYSKGFSDIKAQKPLKGDELFYIYSCSKPATAAAGMQLVERGKILVTDPVSEYLPEFGDMTVKNPDGSIKKAKKPITVGDLFSMTSGLDYNFAAAVEETKKSGKALNTENVVKSIAKMPLAFEPGENWLYGLSHDVLARLVEVACGESFGEYMKKNIFDPLEMNGTTYHMTKEISQKMSEQYEFVPPNGNSKDIVEAQKSGNAKNGEFVNVGKTNHLVCSDEYESGGAGIITSVSDYAKFAAALANFGLGLNGERILNKRTVEIMKSNRLTEGQMRGYNWVNLLGYGYGFGVRTMMRPELAGALSSVGEFGWGGAAGASLWADTSLNLGVFYAQHCLNPRELFYQPRLRNIIYSCL